MSIGLLLMDLQDWFNDPLALVAIIAMTFGVALALLAKRITRAIRGTYSISTSDKVYLVFCTFGLILILIGLVFALIAASSRV